MKLGERVDRDGTSNGHMRKDNRLNWFVVCTDTTWIRLDSTRLNESYQ